MIGTVLDRFEVLQKVGEGGMATVYRGRHLTLGREVAIKVLHPHLSSSTRNRKRFAREARAIEHLRHENILEIFDYSGTSSSECYIITEFVEGETLTELAERVGRVPSEIAAIIGMALADALDYAHGHGVLHRDLKPDNVMVRSDGQIKLMDFGIARFLDESQVTLTGALVGSPAFMSPEQAQESDLDSRSDLFALGTLLFYLVSGQLPFSGTNTSLILKKIIEGTRPLIAEMVPDISATLADVIERLLQTDRDERYPSAASVAADLREALAEVEIDPHLERWGVARFLVVPELYQPDLDAHLTEVLLRRGKELLERSDHLAALRLLNRLLTMDEDNEEVLALVQGLHTEVAAQGRRQWLLLFGAVALAAVAGALILSLQWSASSAPAAPLGARPAPPVTAPPPVEIPALPAPSEPAAPPPAPPAAEEHHSPPTVAAVKPAVRAVLPPTPRPVKPVAERPGVGLLEIRLRPPAWAEIIVDGNPIGHTREPEPFHLEAGEYEVVLNSDQWQDYTTRVNIDAGELTSITDIALEPRPLPLVVSDSFSAACVLWLNGRELGSLEQLGREILISDPSRGNLVSLACPDQTINRTYPTVTPPGARLDP
ncbi:MAG: serine/threonine protein kinase [Deltaproteobacteria bacterium]|nr:serine/threonine protein kinase [Deltaproteobacteria bacterium]